MRYNDIYEFIKGEETAFERDIDINGWSWNFKQHIKTSFYYLHGRLLNGNDEDTPVKNIIRPIRNLQHRAEDVDVKDIVLYVDDPDSYHLSFLVKKYHDDVFAVENDIDSFIDDWKGDKIDYGVGLAFKAAAARPEVRDLQSIAFCDQTDILKGPICFNHSLNPAELMEKEAVGWGSEVNGATATLQDLIDLSEASRVNNDSQDGVNNDTPGQYIEIKELIGVLPASWLDGKEGGKKYANQYHIVGFYKDKNNQKQGVTLFRKKLSKPLLKVTLRDKIYSRCAGYGGVEELFEDQVWTNNDVIRMKDLLDAASKIILKTTDGTIAQKHPSGLKNMDNLEIIELEKDTDIGQLDTFPRNIQLFLKSAADWEAHAQKTGSATDPLLGEPAPSGTPFRAQERQVIEGKSLHEYRRGKYAKDLEGVYKDWFIPHIVEKITEGVTFLSELSSEEIQYVADCLVRNQVNQENDERVLSGELPMTPEERAEKEAKVRAEFMRKGNKHFLKILKGEFKKKPLRVKINVKGKQKDLALVTDKLVNIFRQVIAAPQVLDDPRIAKIFNEILEYSGISPISFVQKPPQPAAAMQLPGMPTNMARQQPVMEPMAQ